MEQHANPIEYLIEFAWANGADRFVVNNAKDELKKLRLETEALKLKNKEWSEEVYRANEFAVNQTNEYLDIVGEMEKLKNDLANPVAWARINSHGDLYRLSNNSLCSPDDPDSNVVPLYAKKENIKQAMSSISADE